MRAYLKFPGTSRIDLASRLTAAAASMLVVVVASSAVAQPQDKHQQACVNAVNDDAAKVAAAQGKVNLDCVKAGTKIPVSPTCPNVDPKGALAKAKAATVRDEQKHCLGSYAPSFGYTSAGAANAAAVARELSVLSDLYGGTDLSSVISTDKTIGKCQLAMTDGTEKVAAAAQGDYVACKKAALKAGTTPAGLAGCVGADAKGKIAGAIAKADAEAGKACASVTVSSAFPGPCSAAPFATLGTCLGQRAKCEMCLAINAEDGIGANCDVVDDGTANGSCIPDSCAHSCPMARGRYTETTTGGALKLATFSPFAFPSGATIVQDVDCGDANCVHDTVIPYPGGLSVPLFCVPALAFTVRITQSGCGVGRIDSNGGSDFTVSEVGDTSTSTGCNVLQSTCPTSGPGLDGTGRLDVTVGDGVADTCSSGTANAIATIPVTSIWWLAADGSCPDGDGTYNAGTDTLVASWAQTFDLTTDATAVHFGELGNPDGCTKTGIGPTGPYPAAALCTGNKSPMACCTGPNTGTCSATRGACIDLGSNAVSQVGSGIVFSNSAPLFDLAFETALNGSVSGPASFGGATCASPPALAIGGTATRCVGP